MSGGLEERKKERERQKDSERERERERGRERERERERDILIQAMSRCKLLNGFDSKSCIKYHKI